MYMYVYVYIYIYMRVYIYIYSLSLCVCTREPQASKLVGVDRPMVSESDHKNCGRMPRKQHLRRPMQSHIRRLSFFHHVAVLDR